MLTERQILTPAGKTQFSVLFKYQNVQDSCDYVIKNVCAGHNTEPPYYENDSKVDARNSSENKRCHCKKLCADKSAVNEDIMVMKTEENCGY